MSTIANNERLADVGFAADECTLVRGQPVWLTQAFAPISLEQLNEHAALLERTDNKYIVTAAVLQQAVPLLAQEFDILEMDGKHVFSYETCYFDDAVHSIYRSHHQGRRRRCKVRMRKYADAGLCFVEIKLKDKRGATLKKRLACTPEQFGQLDQQELDFVHAAYHALYGEAFTQALEPAVTMRYQRITLVAKQGGERMTLDVGLQFTAQGRTVDVSQECYLLETKSSNGNGMADHILRALRERPVSPCSKYCMGLAALQRVNRYNRFLPALRRLGIAAPAPGPQRLLQLAHALYAAPPMQPAIAVAALEQAGGRYPDGYPGAGLRHATQQPLTSPPRGSP